MRSAIVQEHARAFGGGGAAPGVAGGVRGVQRQFDIGGVGACDVAQLGAVDRARVGEIATLHRGLPFAADEIVIARA